MSVKMIELLNRGKARVSYTTEVGKIRSFEPSGFSGDTLRVPDEEVRQLSYSAGGMRILKKYLLIKDEDLRKEILPDVEFEYFFTKEDVINSLKTETAEEIAERLEYAPEGVRDLYESVSVDIELDSAAKRQAVSKGVGKNIDKQIQNKVKTQDVAQPATETKPARRGRTAKPKAVSEV